MSPWIGLTSHNQFCHLTDLRALTLAGPLWHKSVPYPLAVQLLKN